MITYLTLIIAFIVIGTVGGGTITVRIVGGENSKVAQFPYQISLRYMHVHICGGSILNTKYILTAAHCVTERGTKKPFHAKLLSVRAGTHNRIAGGVVYPVKRFTVHERYSFPINDLAVLELGKELVYSRKIQPIALRAEEVPAGSEVTVSGWGLLEGEGESFPITLQWIRLKVRSRDEPTPDDHESLIRLDHPENAGICFGDSGGPAVYEGKLVGVAGFVIRTCGTSQPDGFASVSYHIKWIRKNMQSTHTPNDLV